MERRTLLVSAVSTLAVPAVVRAAMGEETDASASALDAALARFLLLPGRKAYVLHLGEGGALGRFAHDPDLVLFTASAFKTFVLAQYLRDVEARRLSEDAELAVDDRVRMVGSPVLFYLAGTTTGRSILEAMIAHSDNMATDRAMLTVRADRIRALIARAGLAAIMIPDTTRIFASYIFGAPPGVDLGWPKIEDDFKHPPQRHRPLLNKVMTMAGTAGDFVAWYEQVLRGDFFSRPATLVEFKRIQGMSEQIVKAVPADTPAFAKGGEVSAFYDFNAKSFAGQMLVGGTTPATFSFIANWRGRSANSVGSNESSLSRSRLS